MKGSITSTVILLLLATAVHAIDGDIDYKKLFSQEGWGTSKSFLDWAKPLSMVSHKNNPCSDETKARLTEPGRKVIFCEHIATVDEGKSNRAILVYSMREFTNSADSEADCDFGIGYLNGKNKLLESRIGSCADIQSVVNPSDKPVMVFQVMSTGLIGMVTSNHGLECSNRWLIMQQQDSLYRAHLISSRCMR